MQKLRRSAGVLLSILFLSTSAWSQQSLQTPDSYPYLKETHELYEVGRTILAQERERLKTQILNENPALAGQDEELFSLVEKRLLPNVKRNLLGSETPLGRVEINALTADNGGQEYIFIRVVHTATQKSIYYADAEHHKESLKHFNKWLARQHVTAERDVVEVPLDPHGEPIAEGVREHLRPTSAFDLLYWSQYWRAIAQAPLKADIKIGGFCTLAEMALMACVVDLPRVAGEFGELPLASYGVKLFFGTAIGMIGTRTYQNWVELNPRLSSGLLMEKISAVTKRSIVSLVFGISMMVTTQGPHALADWTSWLYMLLNMQISNTIKDETMQWIDIRSRLRMNSGDLVIKNPFTGEKTVLARGQKIFEAQSLRILTGVLRYADISLTGAVGVVALFLQDKVPEVSPWVWYSSAFVVSRVSYLSLTLVPMYFNKKYFERVLQEAQDAYAADPSEINLKRVKNIQAEVVKLQERVAATVSYFKNLPKNLVMKPFHFFARLLGWETETSAEKPAAASSKALVPSCSQSFGR